MPVDLPSDELESELGDLLAAGDVVPHFALLDHGGRVVTTHDLRGAVALLTFAGAPELVADAFYLQLQDGFDKLGPATSRIQRLVVLLPGADGLPALLRSSGWQSLRGADDAVTDLARRAGVSQWIDSSRTAHQTLAAIVIGPKGRVIERLVGTSAWSDDDLVAAVAEGLQRLPS